MSDINMAPWEIEANKLREPWKNLTDAQIRDYVIMRWLIVGGDTRPFYHWVLFCGHQPSRRAIETIAEMMAKSAGVELPPSRTPPFGLTVDRSGEGGAPKDMDAEVAGFCLAQRSDKNIDEGMPPKVADFEAWKFAKECGFDIGVSTIEAQRKKYRKVQGKYLRRPKGK